MLKVPCIWHTWNLCWSTSSIVLGRRLWIATKARAGGRHTKPRASRSWEKKKDLSTLHFLYLTSDTAWARLMSRAVSVCSGPKPAGPCHQYAGIYCQMAICQPACVLLPAATNSWTNLLFFTTTKHRERLHQKSLPSGIPTKNLTSRIRWHSSSWGSCRVASRGRVAPWGGISSCPWIPSTRWCCRVGPSSCRGVSFRNSGIGVLTVRWVHRLLSCRLKHRNGMYVRLLTGH